MDSIMPGVKKDRKAENLLKKQQTEEKNRIMEEKGEMAERKSRGQQNPLLATSEAGLKKKTMGGKATKLSGVE